MRFENLRVPASDILGETGQGFRYAQVRLSPARLTHCMRWLGAARRAHDVAVDYARERHAFGKKIGEHEGIGFMLADNEMDLHTARLSIWHCAWLLDQGQGLGRHASSVAKVISSEAIWRVVDRCVQILGGQGVTHEKIVARIFADVRSFRIYDGPPRCTGGASPDTSSARTRTDVEHRDDDLGPNSANYVPLSPLTFLKRSARVFARKTAVIHGDWRLTYAQLYERVVRLASALANAGLRPGIRLRSWRQTCRRCSRRISACRWRAAC